MRSRTALRILVILAITLLSAPSLNCVCKAQLTISTFDEDCRGVVVKVIDGDTVDVMSISGFKDGQVFRVRFADINAPESSTLEGLISKKALYRLIYGRTVILDIDDLYIYDKYGRVVAVVYLPVNETTLMNVNYWLVLEGYAEITNYPNEFNPYTWTLYVAIGGQLRRSTSLILEPSTFTIRPGDSITITAILKSDGTPLANKPIEFIATPGAVSLNIVYTDANGRATITYTAPMVSIMTTVTIAATFTGDLSYEGSTTTITGTIKPTLALQEASLEGASLTIPKTLRGDVESYRMGLPSDILSLLSIPLPREAFILANHEGIYLVFSNQCDEGYSKVEGWKLPRDVVLAGVRLDVIVAKSVSFEKEGIPVTIGEVLANPRNYTFKLVKIDSNRRQISILYDPDELPEVELPITIGCLTEKPSKPLSIVCKALSRGADLAFNVDLVGDIVGEAHDGLRLFNFKYEYWYDCQAITNGIVIPADHPILKLFKNSLPIFERLIRSKAIVVLYDVKTDIPYVSVSSVAELKNNVGGYMGGIVKLTVNAYGGCISVQEVIEHNTPCSEDRVYMENMGCVNLDFDIRLEGFIAWSDISIPPNREELLLISGVSSLHQDEQFTNMDGVFEIIGMVTSTKQISESLPDGVALIICRMSRVGEIDFGKLVDVVKQEIKDSVGELYYVLQDLYPYTRPPVIPFKIPRVIYTLKAPIFLNTPSEMPQVSVNVNITIQISIVNPETPISLSIINSTISNVLIKLKRVLEDVKVFFGKVFVKPPRVPEPPGLVWAYYNIDTSIPEDAIEHSEITFWVLKEWLAAHEASPDDVVMLRYRGMWQKLPTRLIGGNMSHYKFTAETPGFSILAITTVLKTPTAISITIEPLEVDVGGMVTVKGSISPPMSTVIRLEMEKPDGVAETMITASTLDGRFSFNIRLDKEGIWRFRARFDGDADHKASTSSWVQATAKPKRCLIATAAFGSELAKPVQFLRGFRDEVVMKTFTGRCFMDVFNTWYYLWAPYVAQAEWSYEPLRQAVKYAIYPLIGVLYIASSAYEFFSFNPEVGVVVAGIVVSSLIGLIYFTPIALLVMVALRRRPSNRSIKAIALTWLTAIVGIVIGVAVQSAITTMIFTPLLVLATIAMVSVMMALPLEPSTTQLKNLND